MRTVSGPPWTIDGRWVVVAEWHGSERIVFEPDNGWLPKPGEVLAASLSLLDLHDCHTFVNTQREAVV